MKSLKIIFSAIFILTVFYSNNASAQAVIVRDNVLTFRFPHPDRTSELITIESVSSKSTTTPSGNVVKTAIFQLPEGNFLIPAKGEKSIIATKLKVDGVVLRDARVEVKKTGTFKVILHLNGSGTSSPGGW